jgi:hypothetical protein
VLRRAFSAARNKVARQAQVGPGLRFVLEIAQQVSRVIGHDHRNAPASDLDAEDPSAQAGDARIGAEQ